MASFYVHSSIENVGLTPSSPGWSTYFDICDPNCTIYPSIQVSFSSTENQRLQVKFWNQSEWSNFPATLASPNNDYADFEIRLKPAANTSGYVYGVATGITFSISAEGFDTYTSPGFSVNNPAPGPDTTPPVITVLGANPFTYYKGNPLPFVDPGATVTDDQDLNPSLTTSGEVDGNIVGEYTITYTATDASSNQSTATRTVNVVEDETPPVITLNGDNPLDLTCGESYSEPGATSTDNVDPSPSLDITGSVNSGVPGAYTITYTSEDFSENTATITRTVNVIADTTPPVITLNGNNPQNVALNSTYSDPGAIVTDNCDPTQSITGSGTVNTSVAGSYTRTYSHTDSSGNQATQKTRTVNVVADSNVPPTITLLGANPLQVPVSQLNTFSFDASCLNPGVQFSDLLDTFSYTPGQSFNSSVDGSCGVWFNPPNQAPCSNLCSYFIGSSIGTYYITYGARNSRGLTTRVARAIQVVADTTPPVVTLNGPSTVYVPYRGNYSEQYATALDNNCQTFDQWQVNRQYSSGFNPFGQSSPGIYLITYSATDFSGNTGQAVRTVIVQDDTTPPVVTRNGEAIVNLKHGQTWNDPGFSATDSQHYEWELINTTIGSVNKNVLGTYFLTYRSEDPRGNVGTALRTVNVVPKANPALSINGGLAQSIVQNSSWYNPGYATSDPDGIFSNWQITVTTQGSVNSAVIGTYQVIYTAKDPLNYTTSKTLVVTVRDGIAPEITLLGPSPHVLFASPGSNYPDPGALVSDNIDASRIIQGTGVVDMATPGSYQRAYSTSDLAGNPANPVSRQVIVVEPPDTIPPTIILLGDNPLAVPVFSDWSEVDPGYLVSDNKDTQVEVTITGSVNTSLKDSYSLEYEAKDDANNKSTVTRVVNVVDITPPVLTLNGEDSVSIPRKGNYPDQGASFEDDYDEPRTVLGVGVVNNLVAGSYLLTYSTTDSSGNPSNQIQRTVVVQPDTTPPVLTLNGPSLISLVSGEPYIEQGATAVDLIDGPRTVSVTIQKIQ